MSWEQILPDDSRGLADFLGLIKPMHSWYDKTLTEDYCRDFMTKNKECEIWVEREQQMAMVFRNHPMFDKGHVMMLAIQPGMDQATGLKYCCQIMSDYSARHGDKDLLAVVPKTGCLPHLASFYAYAVSTIAGSNVLTDSERAIRSALPKSGTDEIKDAVEAREAK